MSNLQSLEQRMDRVDYQVISDDKDKQISDLEEQLAETKKALELACKNEFILNAYPRITDEKGYVEHRFDYYIKRAKEMIKSE